MHVFFTNLLLILCGALLLGEVAAILWVMVQMARARAWALLAGTILITVFVLTVVGALVTR